MPSIFRICRQIGICSCIWYRSICLPSIWHACSPHFANCLVRGVTMPNNQLHFRLTTPIFLPAFDRSDQRRGAWFFCKSNEWMNERRQDGVTSNAWTNINLSANSKSIYLSTSFIIMFIFIFNFAIITFTSWSNWRPQAS